MHSLKTPTIKRAAAFGGQAAKYDGLQGIHYPACRSLSRDFREFPVRLSAGTVREVLGLILLSLTWTSTTDSDRAILLIYAEALERLLVDLRRGELRRQLEAAS